MSRPTLRWSSWPQKTCQTAGCGRIEYRGGHCREHWPAVLARLVYGRTLR
jgi:hypothetical protein